MNLQLQSILEMSYSFSKIERDIYYPDRARPENDTEHSFQLALLAWYIIEIDKLNIDALKVFKLCTAHDLVEIYAGDVPLWGSAGHKEKESREQEALRTLKKKLEVNNMTDVMSEYKERKTEEAKFVYGLDKLLPLLNQLNTKGRVWKDHSVSIERALEVLDKHSRASSHLEKYFDEATRYMKENKEKFF